MSYLLNLFRRLKNWIFVDESDSELTSELIEVHHTIFERQQALAKRYSAPAPTFSSRVNRPPIKRTVITQTMDQPIVQDDIDLFEAASALIDSSTSTSVEAKVFSGGGSFGGGGASGSWDSSD